MPVANLESLDLSLYNQQVSSQGTIGKQREPIPRGIVMATLCVYQHSSLGEHDDKNR